MPSRDSDASNGFCGMTHNTPLFFLLLDNLQFYENLF